VKRGLLLGLMRRFMGVVVLCVALAVPVYIFVHAHAPHAPGRLDPPAVTLGAIPSVRPYRDSVPVLTYHDVSGGAGRYTVSPVSFAKQMAALHAAGFHTISMAQLLAFLRGRGQLPERPLVITFDDGLGSAWRVADPILAKYGFRAVAFVITGQIGRHGYYYLRPDELRAMVRSGRWDIEAHTHLAHLYIKCDRAGHLGPALTNREWLDRKGRLETEAEFRSRVSHDLDVNIAELREYTSSQLVFAYPFSAASSQTNDPRVIGMLTQIVAQRFSLSFVDNEGQRFLNRYDGAAPQQLPRIEVYHLTTARSLLARLRGLVPVAPSLEGFPDDQQWISERGSRIPGRVLIRRRVLTLRPRPAQWLAAYWAPTRTELWRSYRLSVSLEGLGGQASGASETVILGSKRSDSYAVSLSTWRLTVAVIRLRGSRRLLTQATVRSASQHRLDVSLACGRLTVSVDGRAMASLPIDDATHGGIGFGTWRTHATSPVPSFSNLSVQPLR